MPPIYLGEFEYAVMLAILHLDTDGADGERGPYAVPIRELIEERTGRPIARGALYTGLDRLEAKGCLRSRMGDGNDDRGGKPKRFYAVTSAGLKAIRATHEAMANMTRGLESILESP